MNSTGNPEEEDMILRSKRFKAREDRIEQLYTSSYLQKNVYNDARQGRMTRRKKKKQGENGKQAKASRFYLFVPRNIYIYVILLIFASVQADTMLTLLL